MARVPRIETSDSGTRIVFSYAMSLKRTLRDTSIFEGLSEHKSLTDQESKILSNIYASVNWKKDKVRFAIGSCFGNDLFDFHAYNFYYYETDLESRTSTEEEQEPYKDSAFNAPDEVYDFTLPSLLEFKNADICDKFDVTISNNIERKRIVNKLQKKIETIKWRKLKSSYIGSKNNLPIEWRDDESDVVSRAEYNSIIDTWESIFGVEYDELFLNRAQKIDRRLKFDLRDYVLLDLVDGSQDETFCDLCGQINDQETFLTLENKFDRSYRVCERCATDRPMFDYNG